MTLNIYPLWLLLTGVLAIIIMLEFASGGALWQLVMGAFLSLYGV